MPYLVYYSNVLKVDIGVKIGWIYLFLKQVDKMEGVCVIVMVVGSYGY